MHVRGVAARAAIQRRKALLLAPLPARAEGAAEEDEKREAAEGEA